jgi:hypothetical protein
MRLYLMMCVLLLASAGQAQVTTSDRLPPPVSYPPEVYRMTDAQFFEWATERNKGALDDWQRRKAAIKEPEYISGSESVVTSDTAGYDNRFFGGWWAYPDATRRVPYFAEPNDYGESSVHRSLTVPRRWPNPRYSSPGPLTLVNPYVRPKAE